MAKMPKYSEEDKERFRAAMHPDAHCPKLVVGGRRSGKTTELLKWLSQAKRTRSYPFWDRVLLVHTTDRAQHLRIALRKEAELKGIDDGLHYNLVYSYEEWKTIHLGQEPVEIAVDDIEFLFHRLFGQTPRLISFHATDVTTLPRGE